MNTRGRGTTQREVQGGVKNTGGKEGWRGEEYRREGERDGGR